MKENVIHINYIEMKNNVYEIYKTLIKETITQKEDNFLWQEVEGVWRGNELLQIQYLQLHLKLLHFMIEDDIDKITETLEKIVKIQEDLV